MLESNTIYQKVKPEIAKIEALRLLALKQTTIALVVAVVVFCLSLLLIPMISYIAVFIGIALAFGCYHFIPASARKRFIHEYKNKLVRSIASAIEPSTTYLPYQGISKSTFKATGHYRQGIDRYSCEDYFSARIGSTDIQFSEIHAQYKSQSVNSNGNTSTTWHDIFKGVMFIADFHKHFHTWLIIKPDNESTPLFGWISKKLQGLNKNNVRMEDPEFEEHFKVYAGNDQQARYILTPDMQQRILKLRRTHGTSIILSLKKSNIYISIPNKTDLYEPSLEYSLLEKPQITKIIYQIQNYFSIVETLNLNTRIWTKE